MIATVPDTARQMRAQRGDRSEAEPPQPATMDPEDVAPFVCYLASDLAADVNGQTFLVYGGNVSLLSLPRRVRTIFKQGQWTLDEISDLAPKHITQNLTNPSPPQAPRQ